MQLGGEDFSSWPVMVQSLESASQSWREGLSVLLHGIGDKSPSRPRPLNPEDTRPQSLGPCEGSLTGASTSCFLENFSSLNPGECQPRYKCPLCAVPPLGCPVSLSVPAFFLKPSQLRQVSWKPSLSSESMPWGHCARHVTGQGEQSQGWVSVLSGFISWRLFPGTRLTQVKLSEAIVTRRQFPRVRLESILPERTIIFQPVMHKERHVSTGHSPLAEAGRPQQVSFLGPSPGSHPGTCSLKDHRWSCRRAWD